MQLSVGLLRSLITYYGNPVFAHRLKHIYAAFLQPGDLYFDIGAHVGSRILAARRLGARVVALEPHPQFFALLERFYGRDNSVTLLCRAVGAQDGQGTLFASSTTPSVSTLSHSWIETVRGNRAFNAVHWDVKYVVATTTLDELIAKFGLPRFCKIDVEGSELDVLRGLNAVLPALTFEFLPAAIELAELCILRLEAQSRYEYNWCIAERFQFGSDIWLSAEDMIGRLNSVLNNGKSGDIYARRRSIQ